MHMEQACGTVLLLNLLCLIKSLKAAFDSINLFVRRKITHVPRGSATKMADNLGVPSSQISRMGQWSQDVMSNSYLDSVPRHLIRKLAGFESDANYYLARAIEEPPAELKRLVFPMADYWYERHTTKNVDQTSGSADGFLLLLKCFQTTFLQDAAAMMDVIPDHPIWKNELFTHPLFLDFRRKVKVHVDAREEPEPELLKKVAPEVQDQLANMNRMISNGFKELARNQQATDALQQTMQQMFNNIVSGRQPLQLSVRLENSSAPTSASASTSTSASASASAYASALVSAPVSTAPVHKMSRGVYTVADLWKEWTLGLDGFWSIQDMDAKYGTAWRKDDRKWYNLRKKEIEAVKKLQNDLGLSPPTAMDTLQRIMSRRNWSLDRLGTELQKGSYDPFSDPKRQKVDDDR
ncbi:hypothetical protein [Parasitella parasitica]|uniref:Transcription activator GCR1-like domain-containing protein n=1 Tax=Parasitella parasitica TaxID=35722 RepID=A0A0B7N843_9FUNG|nr:hypothetical protein [Parasitella parasitica]